MAVSFGTSETASDLVFTIVVWGLFQVNPMTFAVGSTIKRVLIMVAAVAVFGNPISLQYSIWVGHWYCRSLVVLADQTVLRKVDATAAASARAWKEAKVEKLAH